ncbi:hypothetical protein F4054_01705 [Candidatus Poribacteria bacterium]|nr:hypothetical protein [Candidatus Poribacteria bacterium]MYG08681.1 hypothetical protein [Candidatus Poribacteria bacterium]MYK20956.1 hypothetical protein [Candidatus Poribacteria bacterium]
MSKTRFKSAVIAGGIAIWILFWLWKPKYTQPTPDPKITGPTRTHTRARVPLTTPEFDSESFYRTIIDNNIFRPLGWTPPRPIEPYRLIGTILPRSENTPPKAIIQTTAGEKTYIVSIGEPLDVSTRLVSIESKQVVLETDRKQRTLRLHIRF